MNSASTYNDFLDSLVKNKIVNSIAPGWNRMQGITIDRNGLSIFSQSNGDFSSKIWIELPTKETGTKFNFIPPNDGIKMFSVPPSVEQVSLNTPKSNEFSMVFESGAKKYRERRLGIFRPKIIDRIIIFPIKIEE